MLKIIANVSKKVPIPGLDFSSQSFMAGIEVEVSDGSTPEQLQHRIREVYHLLEHAVDTEIRSYGGVPELHSTGMPTPGSPKTDRRDDRHSDLDCRHDDRSGKETADGSHRQSNGQSPRRQEYGDNDRADQNRTSQNREGRTATRAQQKAIHAIAKAKGLDRRGLANRPKEVYGVNTVEELTVGAASELIDAVKHAS